MVCLSVQAEELICVIGANGAGKTSLIRAIAGIVRPTSGRILWRGKDIAGISLGDLRSWELPRSLRAGRCFQISRWKTIS